MTYDGRRPEPPYETRDPDGLVSYAESLEAEIARLLADRDECERQYQEKVTEVGHLLDELQLEKQTNQRLMAIIREAGLLGVYQQIMADQEGGK